LTSLKTNLEKIDLLERIELLEIINKKNNDKLSLFFLSPPSRRGDVRRTGGSF
jgi:hypothetical protein